MFLFHSFWGTSMKHLTVVEKELQFLGYQRNYALDRRMIKQERRGQFRTELLAKSSLQLRSTERVDPSGHQRRVYRHRRAEYLRYTSGHGYQH